MRLEDDEFDELRALAKANWMTVAEWVRQALRVIEQGYIAPGSVVGPESSALDPVDPA